MTVEECYRAFGGDYEGTIDRLVTEERAGTGKLFRLSTH